MKSPVRCYRQFSCIFTDDYFLQTLQKVNVWVFLSKTICQCFPPGIVRCLEGYLATEFLSPEGPAHGRDISLNAAALEQALEHANLMADAAREAILPHFRALQQVDNKLENKVSPTRGSYDPVTIADRNAEQAIREVIERYRPGDGVFGEEFGYRESQTGLTWVIDPIDGTRGFVCGLTTWGTLISLYDGRRSVLGMLDQPVMAERIVGCYGALDAGAPTPVQAYIENLHLQNRGEGAGSRLIRQAIKCSQTIRLEDSLLCITSPDIYRGDNRPFYEQLTAAVASTRYGTDCYGYAMLACGHVDLVVEPDLEPYDIQALIPIVEAAGGVITDWSGKPVAGGGDVVAAATRELHEQTLALL